MRVWEYFAFAWYRKDYIISVSFATGLEFFETSAKDNINVKAVFERLVDIICDKMAESLDSDPNMIPNQTKGNNYTQSCYIVRN